MNVFELANALRSMPDQQLVQLAQMHQNDAAVMAAVMNEKANRDKLRASASAAPAPQGQQPTVREQMLAGLGNIPTEGMTSMADGGIVSFDDGGSVWTRIQRAVGLGGEPEDEKRKRLAEEEARRSRERQGSGQQNVLISGLQSLADLVSGSAQAATPPQPVATPSQPVAPATSSSKHTPLAPEDIALLGRLFGSQQGGPQTISNIVTAFNNRAAGKPFNDAFIQIFNKAKAEATAAAKQAKADADIAVTKASTPVTSVPLSPARTPGSSTAAGLAAAANPKASSPSDASAQSAADPDETLWQLLKQAVTEDARVFGTTSIKVTPEMLDVAKRRGNLTKAMIALYEKQKAMERPVQEAGYNESGAPIMNAAAESASTTSVAPARPAGAATSAPASGAPASGAPTGGASAAAPTSAGTGAAPARREGRGTKDGTSTETAPPPLADDTLDKRIAALRTALVDRQKTEQEGLAAYQKKMREGWLPKEDGSELHKRREEALTKEEEADRRAGNLAWADALISMGAAMMSSKSPTFFGGLGEGVKAGAEEYAKVRDRLAARETRRQDLMMRIDEARTQVKHANAQEKRAFERQAAQEQFNLTRDQARDLAKITGMPEELAIEKIRDDQKREAEWKYKQMELEEQAKREKEVAKIRASAYGGAGTFAQSETNATLKGYQRLQATKQARLATLERITMPTAVQTAEIDTLRKELRVLDSTINAILAETKTGAKVTPTTGSQNTTGWSVVRE